MDREGLKELGPVSHSLWMLYDHTDHAAARPVRDLDPVAAETRLRRQVHGDGGHAVTGRISVQVKDVRKDLHFGTL